MGRESSLHSAVWEGLWPVYQEQPTWSCGGQCWQFWCSNIRSDGFRL